MKKLVLTTLLVFMVSSVGFASPLMDYSKGSVGFDYTYRPNLSMSGSSEIVSNVKLDIPKKYQNMSQDFDGSANLDMGLTIGIGNNWAVQYRQYNPKGTIWSHTWNCKDGDTVDGPKAEVFKSTQDQPYDTWEETNTTNISVDGKIRSDEYNVLYKVSPKVSAFVGLVRTSTSVKANYSSDYTYTKKYKSNVVYSESESIRTKIPEVKSDDENIFQVGLLGSTKLADKLTGYGIVSFGSDYRNWQAGLSYEFAKDWELDVNYRSTKFGKYHVAGITDTYTEDGKSTVINAEANLKDVEAKGWGFGLVYKF